MSASSTLTCGSCGTHLRAVARFCDACGKAVPRVTGSVGERKQITVLFADVVGSMSLATTLDPERLHQVMDTLFTRSAEVVRRFLGTVDKFTGDGLMALFGAPSALEDHALRACAAALEIQAVARSLAAEVRLSDGAELHIRIGLNSGEVVAGDVGSGPGSYTAVGHPVGLAQRMESAALPGTVLCTAATADLVERSAVLAPTEWVAVKGFDARIPARRLEGLRPVGLVTVSDDGPLLGRQSELAALRAAYASRDVPLAMIIGEPGLGKSRLAREFTHGAVASGSTVVSTQCESHTVGVPLRAMSRLLRQFFDVAGLDGPSARSRVTTQLAAAGCAGADDTGIIVDLLPSAAQDTPASTLPAEGRRSRIVEVLAAVAAARLAPTIVLVEDAHWVDEASDALFAALAQAFTGTSTFMVVTHRPEYRGALRTVPHTAIDLTALSHDAATELVTRLVGDHPTTTGAAELIATSAAGNPFFVEEIVRDLAGRGILSGVRGDRRLVRPVSRLFVPATVQSVLAARIDRLSATQKSVLNAAAVVGTQFEIDVLRALVPDALSDDLDELVGLELIDRVASRPRPRYAFRHPLVRSVAYESQLTSTRSSAHVRLASAIEGRDPAGVEQNSALIGHHLESAGHDAAAYEWFMRSGQWLRTRDVAAARSSWERARLLADRLAGDGRDVLRMRIAPRAALTSTAWRVGGTLDDFTRFDELRELSAEAGDALSLAVGMAGRVTSLIVIDGRTRDAAALGSELLDVVDLVDGHVAEVAEALMSVAYAQYEACQLDQALRTTHRLRTIASPEDTSEVGPAAAVSGVVKILLGQREAGTRDLHEGLALAGVCDPVINAMTVAYDVDLVVLGFNLVDDTLVAETAQALRRADDYGHAYGKAVARLAHGTVLLRHGDRDRAIELLNLSRAESGLDPGGALVDAEIAADSAARGEGHQMIDVLAAAIDDEIDEGSVLFLGYPVAVLVDLLLTRGGPGDVQRAKDMAARIDADDAPVLRLWPLRCQALLTQADGDAVAHADAVNRYVELATELDARGHLTDASSFAIGRLGQ